MLKQFKSKKILITGATGCLGRALLEEMLKHQALVWVTQNRNKIERSDVEVIQFEKGWGNKIPFFDYVFHLAAKVDVSENVAQLDLEDANVELTKRIIEKVKFKKLIFASTVSVYQLSSDVITESSKINPHNTYALTKWEAEKLVKKLPHYCILRYSSLFGQGMNTNTFLPKILKQAIKEKSMKVYGDGSRMQNYIHVNQAVQYLIHGALKLDNCIGLAVAPKEYSNLEIAQVIAEDTQAKIKLTGEDFSPSFRYDNQNTLKELALELKKNTITNDIKRLIQWMKSTKY